MGNEDVDTGLFSVEVKSRKKFVGDGFMSQAKANCQPGKMPLVVVHIHGRQHTDDLVMVRMEDFEGLYGTVKGGNEHGMGAG